MRRIVSITMLLAGMALVLPAQAPSMRATPPTGEEPTKAKAHAPGLLVRIHVFSGRKDPEFRITDPAEIARIMAILNANAAEDTKAESPEVITHKLGYRGIEIIADAGVTGLGNVTAFAVNRNRIQVHHSTNGTSRATLHQDVAGELEQYLLERGMAQGQVDTGMIQRIHRQH